VVTSSLIFVFPRRNHARDASQQSHVVGQLPNVAYLCDVGRRMVIVEDAREMCRDPRRGIGAAAVESDDAPAVVEESAESIGVSRVPSTKKFPIQLHDLSLVHGRNLSWGETASPGCDEGAKAGPRLTLAAGTRSYGASTTLTAPSFFS
jgi:hypothetical protein